MAPTRQQPQRQVSRTGPAQRRPAPPDRTCQVIPAGAHPPCPGWGRGENPRLCKVHRSEHKALYLAYKAASRAVEKLRPLVDAEPDWQDEANWTAEKLDAAIAVRERYVRAVEDEVEQREAHRKRFVAEPDEGHTRWLELLRTKREESDVILTQLRRCRTMVQLSQQQAEDERRRRASDEASIRLAVAARQAEMAAARRREEEAQQRREEARKHEEAQRQEAWLTEERRSRAAAETAREIQAFRASTTSTTGTPGAATQARRTEAILVPQVQAGLETRASQPRVSTLPTSPYVPPIRENAPLLLPGVQRPQPSPSAPTTPRTNNPGSYYAGADVERQGTALGITPREDASVNVYVLVFLGVVAFFVWTRWIG